MNARVLSYVLAVAALAGLTALAFSVGRYPVSLADIASLAFSKLSAGTPSLPPGAVAGPAGFPIEPFTFTFQGSFFHLANFFGRLVADPVSTEQDQLGAGGARCTVAGGDVGAHRLPVHDVMDADNAGQGDRRVLEQGSFDLERADV